METGQTASARRRLVQVPPEPPFVAIAFGQRASHPVGITVDQSRIIINGPVQAIIDRPRLAQLAAIVQRIGQEDFNALMGLRHRLAGGRSERVATLRHGNDQEAYMKVRSSGIVTAAEFRTLPEPGSYETTYLQWFLQQ